MLIPALRADEQPRALDPTYFLFSSNQFLACQFWTKIVFHPKAPSVQILQPELAATDQPLALLFFFPPRDPRRLHHQSYFQSFYPPTKKTPLASQPPEESPPPALPQPRPPSEWLFSLTESSIESLMMSLQN